MTCMSPHVYRLLHGVLPDVLTLLLSPSAPDEKQDVWAGVGDRRGWYNAHQSPRFSNYLESLWIRGCSLRLPRGGPEHYKAHATRAW